MVLGPPINDRGKGRGRGCGKGQPGNKGRGRTVVGMQKVQLVYVGDVDGRVTCTVATRDDVIRVPITFPQNAYVVISLLMYRGTRAFRSYFVCGQGSRVQVHLSIRRYV